MSRTRAWLGVDLGTSGLKVLAVDSDGRPVAETEAPLTVSSPSPGRAEASVPAWLASVDTALAPLLSRLDVAGIGVTGQMHGTVLLGSAGSAASVLAPAVLWPDERAAAVRGAWDSLPAAVLGRLGGPWSPGMTGPVLAWLASEQPELAARAEQVVLPKDVVRMHLAPGSPPVTDASDAAGTLLRDVVAGEWSPEASALLPAGLLPRVVGSGEVVGSHHGAPLVVGGGDTPVSLVALEAAVGGWLPGDLVVNLGTGAQVIDPSSPVPAPGSGWPVAHTYDDCSGGHYTMVAAQNAGLALTWAMERLGVDWARFSALAAAGEPGANGVTFSPFTSGERGALVPVTGVQPGWTGLPVAPDELGSLTATRRERATAQAARSAAEAQAFLVRRAVEVTGAQPERVLLVGGGGRDDWVRELLADALGVAVQHVPMRSAAASGAALLAGAPSADAVPLPPPTPAGAGALDDAYTRWREAFFG